MMYEGIGQYLTLNGEPDGQEFMSLDWSSTPINYFYECPERFNDRIVTHAEINKLKIYLQGGAEFRPGLFGSEAALTNGVFLNLIKDGKTTNLHEANPIKANRDWAGLVDNYNYEEFSAGSNFLNMIWMFDPKIPLSPGEKFTALLNDDFEGLDNFNIYIEGQLFFD